MQICESPTSTHITALFELPGLKNSDINVNVTRDGTLTVSGERRAPTLLADAEHSSKYFPIQEIKYGKFERSLKVPTGVEVCLISFHPQPNESCTFCDIRTHSPPISEMMWHVNFLGSCMYRFVLHPAALFT
jgi:hypothetical protein